MNPKQPLSTYSNHLLFFILLFCNSFFFSNQQLICNHQDQSSLLAFSANISTIPPWLPLNWSFEVSCCQWEGVECDLKGRVTHLELPSRSLKGVILISSISSLSMLTHLNLSNNFLHGSLGEDIIKPKNLKIIDLSGNSIGGSIPQEIGKLSYLQKLHLYENNLSGPIPPSLMNCTHLAEIILSYNRLNGDISTLDFSKLAQLQKIDLGGNSLTGVLPESVFSCNLLIALRVSNNNINGQISPAIVKLKSLSFLSVTGNSLTNITLTLRVLATCKNLTTLFLSSNFHGESLPVHNNFISVGEFPKLQFFSLAMCNFEAGPIPSWLSTIKSLRATNMGGNKLTGHIPNWLGTLPKLFYLLLNNNSLSGEVPPNLWQLPALISENALADLGSAMFELPIYMMNENLSRLESIRFKSSYYRTISLKNNAFTGHIPEEIGDLRNLQRLYLDKNSFSGHIPDSISKLHSLERLDLSENKLTGEIPTSLANLSFLSMFNVSYNNLHGPIPTGGQFGTFDEAFFQGNPGLYGKPLNQTCYSPTPLSEALGTNESHENKIRFLDGLFVGFASGFSIVLIFIGSFVWYHNSERSQRPSSRRGKLNFVL